MEITIIVQDIYDKLFVIKRAIVTLIEDDGSVFRSDKIEKGYGYDVKSKAISDAFDELGIDTKRSTNIEEFAKRNNLILDYMESASGKIQSYFLRKKKRKKRKKKPVIFTEL